VEELCRLKTYADLLSQEQNGFRRNTSTTDNIFIMQQILEKCYEYNIEMHVLFIDSVDRQKNHADTAGIEDTK